MRSQGRRNGPPAGMGAIVARPPSFTSFRGVENMKKTYASPTLVKHGNAVQVTLGMGGRLLELINFRPR